MAPSKLEIMRAKLAEREARRGGGGSSGGDKASYQFWNIPDNSSCTLRFVPDLDENNMFFWVESMIYRWTLADNLNPGKTLNVNIPCIEMYDPDGNTRCPIKKEVGDFFRTGDEETGRKFWPKSTFIYNGFVRKSTLNEAEPPENPIRIFTVNKPLHKIIKSAVFSDDEELTLDELPTDFERGTDFIIKKTKNGKWAEYNESGYSKRQSALTDDELAALEKFKPWNLSSRLPQKPSDEALVAVGEIFEAAIEGLPWKSDWDKYFKPWRDSTATRTKQDDENTGENVPAPREQPVQSAAPAVASDALSKLRTKAAAAKAPESENAEEADSAQAPAEVVDTPVEAAPSKPATASKTDTAALLARLRKGS